MGARDARARELVACLERVHEMLVEIERRLREKTRSASHSNYYRSIDIT
ncbi:hypothetical protein [Hyperthermus butylicus]|nr:hypothetical protein [Hyperthermus butylicus]